MLLQDKSSYATIAIVPMFNGMRDEGVRVFQFQTTARNLSYMHMSLCLKSLPSIFMNFFPQHVLFTLSITYLSPNSYLTSQLGSTISLSFLFHNPFGLNAIPSLPQNTSDLVPFTNTLILLLSEVPQYGNLQLRTYLRLVKD